MIYRSKIDWWLMVILFVPFIWGGYDSIKASDYTELGILALILVAVIWLLLQIKYVVKDGLLEVKTGIFGTQRIHIKDIRSVTKTYNPLSAPALSINRLEVKYGSNFDYVLISPKDRENFIKELKTVNPDIAVHI